MTPLRIFLISAGLAASLASAMNAQAQALPAQTVPLRAAMQSLVDESAAQCPKMAAALEAEKNKYDANNYWFAKEYQASLCQCQPAKVKVLLAQRPEPAELAQAVTQQQAMDYLMTHATAPCVGVVFRELMAGKQCKKLMDPAVCDCLAPEIAGISDLDILQGGIAFQQHREALTKAKAAGAAPPAVPAAAAPLVKLKERCSKAAG